MKQPGQYPPPDETDRGKPKAEQAYEFLRDAVISMRLEPNSIIAEKELCAELGISRTPLREAVLRLAHEGLVSVVPGDGTFVSRISLRGVLQGYLVRSSIELRMVRLAARYYTEDFDRDFNILQFLQQDANKRLDYGLALRLDTEFHQLICRVAGFPDIWSAVHNATGQLDRLRYRAFDKQGMRKEIEEEHAAIHKALQAHDEDLAHALLRKHLNDISDVIDFVKSYSPEILFMEEELDLGTLLNA